METNLQKLQLYEKGNGSIEIEQFEPVTIRRIAGNQCFDAAVEEEFLKPGEAYRCNTGIKMPEERDLSMVIDFKSYEKSWEYECEPLEDSPVC